MTARILVAYATRNGSTAGIAQAIGKELVSAGHTVDVDELKKWTQSENCWMRRAAAVSLIVPAKHGKFLDDVFSIADLLLTDSDDMVQKGYGWPLKEASQKHTDEVFGYVMRNKRSMPRTALRYAIELMPEGKKVEAMKKEW